MSTTPKKLTYTLAGLVLAAGAPLGWLMLSTLAPDHVSEYSLYIYLSVGTTLAFGGFGFVLGHIHDRLRESAKTDPLTGVWNQQAFLDFAQVLLNSCDRDEVPLSLIALDIDHFKQINDSHGHLFGSHVLHEVAKIIRHHARKADVIGRYGGDEFMLCLPRTGAIEASALAQRIRRAVESSTFEHSRRSARITVTVGIAETYGKTFNRLPALLDAADQALYDAKDAGRNRTAVWTAEGISLVLPDASTAGARETSVAYHV